MVRIMVRTKVLLLFILLVLLFIPMVQAVPEQAMQRVIAHTISPFDKVIFKQNGCKLIHELDDATAIECPETVYIANAEPDEILYILDAAADTQIHADDVWDLNPSITGSGVVVAVLDTGVDYTHQELQPHALGEIPVTNGGIGGGESFVSYTTDFMDDNGHGTHVSGILTADGKVKAAAKGAAPDATIWMAKVCNAKGSCYVSDIAAAIQFVVDNHVAHIMSISLGGGGTTGSACDSDYLAIQINRAYDNGVVTAAAAGNSGTPKVGSPACASTAIAVAAVDRSDNRASFSSYGKALEDHGVAAPGVRIYSTLPGNQYASWSGTSMATPHVSALAALMFQADLGLVASDLRSRILHSADCLNNKYGTCPNIYIGFGRVDALAAVGPDSPPADKSFLIVTADPSEIATDETSTITASTSNGADGVMITFESSAGSSTLSSPTCSTENGGSCMVIFTPMSAGSATITASAADSYQPGSTTVTITTPSECIKSVNCNCNGACHPRKETHETCPWDCPIL